MSMNSFHGITMIRMTKLVPLTTDQKMSTAGTAGPDML